jgi:hypothetical protein
MMHLTYPDSLPYAYAVTGSRTLARLLRCEPAEGTQQFAGLPGDTVPGFRVVEAEEGRRLSLRGRHRFAIYDLTFVLDGSVLCARFNSAPCASQTALSRLPTFSTSPRTTEPTQISLAFLACSTVLWS